MDIALALDHLVPGANYRGSLTRNIEVAFDALEWLDGRAKPSWAEIVTADPTANAVVAEADAKQQANNQATLIVAELFVDLIESLLASATIAATDFPADTRAQYQTLKTLVADWRAL